MIATKGLHIGYSNSIVHVEDLDLNEGVYILVGKNGSGKSTFLKTITGQINPIEGNVQLGGKELSTMKPAELPTTCAFVSSQFPQIEFLLTEEYIGLSRSPYTNFFGTITSHDKELINQTMSELNIEHLKGRYTSELSDGERQLVAIAKAVSQETPIITLDEPTAFLDYSNKRTVLQALLKISKEHKKCILISSHDIDLSIDANCPFLVVSKENRQLSLHPAGISKDELIRLAFSE
jgi:iron complex transport system ATP-binding protein